jgi:diguanylate cyclase (GGDEF)-like protein
VQPPDGILSQGRKKVNIRYCYFVPLAVLLILYLLSSLPSQAADDAVKKIHQQAQQEYKKGNITGAISIMEEVLRKDPSYLEGYNDLGCFYTAQHAHNKAAECFRKALAMKADDLQILYNLGNCHLAAQEFDQAIPIFRKVLVLEPSYILARHRLTIALARTKRLDEATVEAQKLVQTQPDNSDYQKLLIQIHILRNRKDEAAQALASALEKHPQDSELIALAESLRQPGATPGHGNEPVPSGTPGEQQAAGSPEPPSPASPGSTPPKGGRALQGTVTVVIFVLATAALAGLILLVRRWTSTPYPQSVPLLEARGVQHRMEGNLSTEETVGERPGKPSGTPEKSAEPSPDTSRCWILQDCPAGQKESCKACAAGQNCWSTDKTPCCAKDRALCILCQYYAMRLQKATRLSPQAYKEITVEGGDAALLDTLSNPQMAFFKDLSSSLSAAADMGKLGNIFLNKILEACGCSCGALFISSRDRESLSLLTSAHWEGASLEEGAMPLSSSLGRWVAENSFPMHLKQAERDMNWTKLFASANARELAGTFALIHPLVEEKGKILGLLFLSSRKTGAPFQASELSLITLACGMMTASLGKAKARMQADFDSLTGLYVVRSFHERLQEELSSPRSLLKGCSLLMLDIDHFKSFNDRYGHQQGDRVLGEVGGLILKILAPGHFAARYGGEELAVILPLTDKEAALEMGETIRSAIMNQHFEGFPEEVRVTISVGVAAYPYDARSPQELIGKADQALYRAKNSGRNRVC